MADMNPTGVTTLDVFPGAGTGYITVNGEERLALTSSWDNSASEPKANPDKYEYYVGDFTNGYAPVLKVADNTATQYAVDEWYNIYSVKDGEYVADLTQTQVNSDTVIQQNAFYKDSVLHVYKTGFSITSLAHVSHNVKIPRSTDHFLLHHHQSFYVLMHSLMK